MIFFAPVTQDRRLPSEITDVCSVDENALNGMKIRSLCPTHVAALTEGNARAVVSSLQPHDARNASNPEGEWQD